MKKNEIEKNGKNEESEKKVKMKMKKMNRENFVPGLKLLVLLTMSSL